MKPIRDSADALDASIDTLLHREEPENDMGAQAGVTISPGSARVIQDLHALAESTPMRDTFMRELEAQLLQEAEALNAASMSTAAPHSSADDNAPSKQATNTSWWQRVARRRQAFAGSSRSTQANRTVATASPQTNVSRKRRLFSPALVIVGMALVVAFFIVISALLQARRDVIPVAKAGTSTATILAPAGTPVTTTQSDFDFVSALEPLVTIDANQAENDTFGKTTIAWNPNGSSIASISLGGNIMVWDAVTGKRGHTIQTGREERLEGLAWSPDGRILASRFIDGSTGWGLVALWDAASGQQLDTFTLKSGRVMSMAWSPDGQTLAWTDGWSITLWDATSSSVLPKPQPTWPAPIASEYIGQNMVTNLAWSPDGHSLATSQGHIVKLWDPTNGKELMAFEAPERTGTVSAMSWSSDGHVLAFSAMIPNTMKAWMRTWDVTTGQALKSFVTYGFAPHIAWSPNRNILAYGIWSIVDDVSHTTLTLYNPVTGEVLRTIDTLINDLAWSPDGRTLAIANGIDGTITLWGVTTGQGPKVTAEIASPTAHVAKTTRPTFAPTAIPPATPSAVPTQDCNPGWAVVNIPDPGEGRYALNGLEAVAAISPNDVWVVGSTFIGRDATTGNGGLTMHWDGTQWNTVPGGGGDAIAAIATDDVWTVIGPNTMHWDGAQWSKIPIATPDESNGIFLNGIAATSSSDVWAVGYYGKPNVGEVALIEHWDGTRWSVVLIPDIESAVGAKLSQLRAVAAVSPTDIWAMGDYTDGEARHQTLALHWNGAQWSIVASPNLPGDNYVVQVAAVAANDIWAVGPSYVSVEAPSILILHWDGNEWNTVRAPDAGPGPTIGGIAAVSANDVWMVGASYNSESGESVTLTLHWDGTEWRVVPSPNLLNPRKFDINVNFLADIAALPSGDVWAVGVGATESGGQGLLVLRYRDAPCPTPIGP